MAVEIQWIIKPFYHRQVIQELVWYEITTHPIRHFDQSVEIFLKLDWIHIISSRLEVGWRFQVSNRPIFPSRRGTIYEKDDL